MAGLLDAVAPEIYRTNPFRILALPDTATSREVRRQLNTLAMELRLGVTAIDNIDTPLRLRPPPGEEAMKAAQDKLLRPVDRFFAEMFWFWTPPGQPDPVYDALGKGQIDEAAKLWSTQAATSPTACHNLAVLNHLLALDDEIALRDEPGDRTRAARLQTEWTRALTYWRQACADDRTWEALRRRASDHADVRLTDELVEEMRHELAPTLLRINIHLALAAAEREDRTAVQRNMKAICDSGMDSGVVDRTIAETVRINRDRMEQVTKAAESQWADMPQRANRTVAEMESAGGKILTVIETIVSALPKNVTAKIAVQSDAVYDLLAETMRKGQIAYTSKTNDWQEGIRILERAVKLARGGTIRDRLTNDIKELKEARDSGGDWCAPGYWDLPEATIVELEKARELARAGKFEDALRILLALDASIGQPLRRAVAYCLNGWNLRDHRTAMGEYNADTAVRKRLKERIIANPSVLGEGPTPTTPSYMMPPCLAGCNRRYTSWVNFKINIGTVKEVPVWMCSACNDDDDRQIEAQKKTVRPKVTACLEFLMLAREIDPKDKLLAKNENVVRDQHRRFNCPAPNVAGLRRRLGGGEPIRVREAHVPPEHKADKVCFFCNLRPPAARYAIALPYWREDRRSATLLSEAVTLKEGQVTVPRCLECHNAHKALTAKRQQWEAETKARREWEAKQQRERQKWETEQEEARRRANTEEAASRRKQEAEEDAAVERAIAAAVPYPKWVRLIGPNSVATGGVLAGLGGVLLRDGRVGVDVLPLATWTSLHLPIGMELSQAIMPALVGGLGGLAVMAVLASFSSRRSGAVEKLRSALRQERTADSVAARQAYAADWEARNKAWADDFAAQRKKYADDWARQCKEYADAHPEPRLPAGLRAEAQFGAYPTVATLRAAGWKFGAHGTGTSNATDNDLGKIAKGLVAA